MAIISLVCEQCGGSIVLDSSHETGICEHCFSQYAIREDKIYQYVTQNITKHVYGVGGKDIEELLDDAYRLYRAGDERGANSKFRQAIGIDGSCWRAWLGYADTRGDNDHPLSMVPAYRAAYRFAQTEEEDARTFVNMTDWIPNGNLRSSLIHAYNVSPADRRDEIFDLVAGVIGCDESEIALLANDLSPNDWRAMFAMAQERQIRARWSKPKGLFHARLPEEAEKVLELFCKAYQQAKKDGDQAAKTVSSYIDDMARDSSYAAFAHEVRQRIDAV